MTCHTISSEADMVAAWARGAAAVELSGALGLHRCNGLFVGAAAARTPTVDTLRRARRYWLPAPRRLGVAMSHAG